jgi:hypothetical protein
MDVEVQVEQLVCPLQWEPWHFTLSKIDYELPSTTNKSITSPTSYIVFASTVLVRYDE